MNNGKLIIEKTILLPALTKKQLIYQKDLEEATVLANDRSEPALFYSLEEIAGLTEDLIGIDTPKGKNGKTLNDSAKES